MFESLILIVVAAAAAALSIWFCLRMFKLKRVSPRFSITLLKILVCFFVIEILAIANDFSSLTCWAFGNVIITAVVWIVYIGGKHLKTKK